LVQAAEGTNTAGWGDPRFTTSSDTLTPVTYAAYQDVSRQLLDASDPAVDALIFGDLRAAWDQKIENLVCAAILASGTAFQTVSADVFTGVDAAGGIDYVIDAEVAVSEDLRGPADLAVMNFARFGTFRKMKDGSNRPLMPVSRYNPQNANGALGNTLMGDIEGVDALATAGVPTPAAEANEQFAVLRAAAVILAESDVLDFTYDQVAGPSAVRMGIWGYVGTLVRNPGSVQVITVTPGE
jgi:HK97 family phage major capsid protein